MTTNTTARKLALLVQVEERHGQYRAVARVVMPTTEDGTLTMLSPQWHDRYEHGEHAARFEGFEIAAYVGNQSTWGSNYATDTDDKLWGFGVSFAPYRIDQADHAQAIARTLAAIDRGLRKASEDDGYIRDGEFARYVLRIAKILKIKDVYIRNLPRAYGMSGERYRLTNGFGTLDYWATEVMEMANGGKVRELVKG